LDVGGIIVAFLLAIAWAEAAAWLPKLTDRIVRRAAKRLSPDLQSRMEEEWLRYVQDMPGTLSPFISGCQCFRASVAISPIRIRPIIPRLALATKLRNFSVKLLFSDREFFIHDGKRLRRFKVSAPVQAFFFFLSLVLVGWSGYSAASLFVR
jgi:hypothetical protein